MLFQDDNYGLAPVVFRSEANALGLAFEARLASLGKLTKLAHHVEGALG